MVTRPEGWNQGLYEKLKYEHLVYFARNNLIGDWNLAYEAYLKSEWTRIYPDQAYDAKNIRALFENGSDFVRLDYNEKDFKYAIPEGVDIYLVHLYGADFSGIHLEGADFCMAQLDGVKFINAHLYGANFTNADLDGAEFICSDLEGVKFINARLEDADFTRTHLKRADFTGADIRGSQFRLTILNGETMFSKNLIDDSTNFTGTSLFVPRIDPELRTELERNIRQIRWEKWYKEPKVYPALASIKKSFIPDFSKEQPGNKKKWETKHSCIDSWTIDAFVRFFWWISNYGSSTKRIICVFFGWNLFWALIYYYVIPVIPGPFLAGTTTTVMNVSNIGTAILQTNLMMFSITDLATIGLDFPALICVTIHIIVGYFILVALITRLGIMFQSLSP
ncbi:MAG: pentapeptide repeat-containing protein [Methanocorpusculum sp.]|jgi:uncharacterized protein YjbI with pentapeptide repeats|nr:pentapeptide repeat-containing protein [Methanocorpusculum sp.]MDD3256650.1 pentapeptide repeat-containing protein [Methanocorpusculum sp.]